MYIKTRLRRIILFVIVVCIFMLMAFISGNKYKEQINEQTTTSSEQTGLAESVSESVSDVESSVESVESVSVESVSVELAESSESMEGFNSTVSTEVEEIESSVPEEDSSESELESEPESEEENEGLISLGEFKLTAYCSCRECCGIWADNRPLDENGNEIIYGASGERLTAGISIAVDPYVIPYGTEVIINGHTYIAHDTGGAINGNRIDVYFDNHQEAWNFGLQYAEVFIKNN